MGKANVLLVNPWIYDFAAYDFWVRPLGLYILAALMRGAGCGVRLIDCLDPDVDGLRKAPRRDGWGRGKFCSEKIPGPQALRFIRKPYRRYGMTPAHFRRLLASCGRPDAVLVGSLMTYWYPGVVDAVREVRAAWPGVPVILGGTYATLCGDHARAHSGADCVLSGPGESTLPPALGEVAGCCVAFDVDVTDPDSYPYPAFDLSDRFDSVPILTSRGCPFRCTYCASTLLGGPFRERDPVRVVDEIEHWHRRRGVVDFAFYDDALLVDAPRRAVPMLEEILRRGLACRFHCPNGLHAREISPRLASLMYRAGFRTIRLGFETASAERQEATGGKVTSEELRRAVAYLREAGYRSGEIGVYLLCGLPGQDAREVACGIDLVRAAGARPMLAEYSPIPGTALWGEALRHARYDIAGEPLFQNNSLLPCLSPTFGPGDVQALKNRARQAVANADRI